MQIKKIINKFTTQSYRVFILSCLTLFLCLALIISSSISAMQNNTKKLKKTYDDYDYVFQSIKSIEKSFLKKISSDLDLDAFIKTLSSKFNIKESKNLDGKPVILIEAKNLKDLSDATTIIYESFDINTIEITFLEDIVKAEVSID